MMCGATAASSVEREPVPPPRREDRETLRFVRAIIKRPATFTFAFILANIFLYLLMKLSGGATGDVLLAYGAKRNDLINAGQWWRLVTPVFLHVDMPGLGPLHLIVNMYGLFMLGPYVEKLYGSAKFVTVWVLTGVAGVFASYLTVRPDLAHGALGRFLFKAYDAPSAGASGALFGLVGVLFVFGLKYRHELPEGLKRAFGTGMLPAIVFNLFIGYIGRGFIDNAAHLGGLLSGMALALLMDYKRLGERGPVSYAWHFAQVLCLAFVIAGFVAVGRNFDVTPPWRPGQGQSARGAPDFIEAVNAGQNAFVNFTRGESGALGPAAEKLKAAPRLSEDADRLVAELNELLAGAAALASERGLARADRDRRLEELSRDFARWQEHFDQWVEAEGKELGIVFQKGPEEKK
jgi:membrane associated rhomboid family serine protease